MRDDFKRLGGWLLFYDIVTTMSVIMTVTSTLSLITTFGESQKIATMVDDKFMFVFYVTLAASIITTIAAGYRIYLIHSLKISSSIRKTKNLLLIEGAVKIVSNIVFISSLSKYVNHIQEDADIIVFQIASSIGTTIWVAIGTILWYFVTFQLKLYKKEDSRKRYKLM